MNDKISSKNSQRTRGYMIFLFIFMMLYEFMDSYTTSYYTSVVSYIQADLHIDDSTFYIIQAVASVGLLLVVFIQNLADRVGRKPMMIVVFFGMGFASLIMLLANGNMYIFTVGFFLSWIFFSSDMWVIVVSEEAPAKKRATFSYLIAVVGALGAIAIPICRTIFVGNVDPTVDPTVWRGMNYLALFAMGFALMGFGMKETNAFLDKKLHDKNETNETDKKTKRARLFAPFAKPVSAKRIAAFIVIGFLLGMMAAVISTFEDYLTGIIVLSHGGDPSQVTTVIYVATFGTFAFFGITGLLADKLGRKPTLYIYAAINVCFFAIMAFTADFFATNAIWVFSIFGFFMNGSFWGMFMLSKTYCVENFSTDMRGTAAGWRSFAYAIGLILGSLVSSILVTILDLQYLFLAASAITGIGISVLTATLLPETKGVDIVTDST